MRRSSILKLGGGVIYTVACFGVPLFLAAWTLDWPRAWVFLCVVFAAAAATMFGLFPSRPDLLDERYKAPVQTGQPLADRVLVLLLLTTFIGLLVFIPLDVFRFRLLGGPSLPVSVLALALFVAGWIVLALAVRANAFAALVVRHQEERHQVVVDRGPYAVVRHPMYAGAIPLMIGMPLWLGSYAGALLAAVPLATLVMRVRIEERFLRRQLEGYEAYTQRVRWRLVPFVW
jgi:protein-S-isoprenylcysteine O-methyltransferase Ste14